MKTETWFKTTATHYSYMSGAAYIKQTTYRGLSMAISQQGGYVLIEEGGAIEDAGDMHQTRKEWTYAYWCDMQNAPVIARMRGIEVRQFLASIRYAERWSSNHGPLRFHFATEGSSYLVKGESHDFREERPYYMTEFFPTVLAPCDFSSRAEIVAQAFKGLNGEISVHVKEVKDEDGPYLSVMFKAGNRACITTGGNNVKYSRTHPNPNDLAGN